jgi:hypothetical protein
LRQRQSFRAGSCRSSQTVVYNCFIVPSRVQATVSASCRCNCPPFQYVEGSNFSYFHVIVESLSESPCYVWIFHFLQRVVLAWFRSWRLRAALGLPHDFATEHSLISLHVWILHNRFRLDYDGRGILCGRYVASVHDFCLRLWEVAKGIMRRFPACFGFTNSLICSIGQI